MIIFVVGLPGQGKSFYSARQMQKVLLRNKRWFKKSGILRKVYTNLPISNITKEKWKDYIVYWSDPYELSNLRDVDIFWDEVAQHMDARDWERLPQELKSMLQLSDKRGLEIFANTQMPMQVDVAFRRLCNKVLYITKIFGSRRPSNTRPPVRIIWGLCVIQKLKRGSFSEEVENFQYEKDFFGFPYQFLWIDRHTCNWYDTKGEIKGLSYPPLKHVIQKCLEPGCGKWHTGHLGKMGR